jgi:hypothetical protein
MGREVRRVPADWKHPKEERLDRYGQVSERYKPLFQVEDYIRKVGEWDDECAKWKSGWRPAHCTDPADKDMCYEQWAGQRPNRDNYMPNWPAEQRTHYMMYEDTSEGTPISPAFETPEALARWLADTWASSFAGAPASYEAWLWVANGGFAPSAISVDGGPLVSGVDAFPSSASRTV